MARSRRNGGNGASRNGNGVTPLATITASITEAAHTFDLVPGPPKIRIKRTLTSAPPPLLDGELAVQMFPTPPVLWIGANGTNKTVASPSVYLPITGGTANPINPGPLRISNYTNTSVFPSLEIENSIAGLTDATGGLWRISVGNVGNLNIQASSSGDFATTIQPVQIRFSDQSMVVGGPVTVGGNGIGYTNAPGADAPHAYMFSWDGGHLHAYIDAVAITNGIIAGAKLQVNNITLANPGAATSATLMMAGIGVTFTPVFSGNVFVAYSGMGSNNTGGGMATVRIQYGAGTTPPAYNAALTGTQATRGTGINTTATPAGQQWPWSLSAVLTGLTIGTTYWVDLAQSIGAAGIGQVNIVAINLAYYEI
jgi:hypothetical protein